MNWKLTYIKQREDMLYEARMEDEGLFTIGVAATKEAAIKEAERKTNG